MHINKNMTRLGYLQSGLHLIQIGRIQRADPRLQEFYGVLAKTNTDELLISSKKEKCSHLCSVPQFSGGTSNRQGYEYRHFIQCVLTESTIKLPPCTPALRGPCNTDTKRRRKFFTKKAMSQPCNLNKPSGRFYSIFNLLMVTQWRQHDKCDVARDQIQENGIWEGVYVCKKTVYLFVWSRANSNL